MYPPSFDYAAPDDLDEALKLLELHNEDAKIMTGGVGLINAMKHHVIKPGFLIDISRIRELGLIGDHGGYLSIGAAVKVAELQRSDLVKRNYTALSEAAGAIADPLLRNMISVGGNVCTGNPDDDLPPVFLSMDAQYILAGRNGRRVIDADGFYLGHMSTAIRPGEILVEVRVPRQTERSGSAYIKRELRQNDHLVAGVAASISLEEDGRYKRLAFGLSGSGNTSIHARLPKFTGSRPVDVPVGDIAKMVVEEASPLSDRQGSASYKRKVILVLAREALTLALQRAEQGGQK
ncbi:MAG: xanthine dehydrogenase family protein subunit M [Nitrososphaerota archaeon]|nr:xanthine dehydrogenase family protein subunit M [Nitrososphaerota archaeon]MDG7049086.1 xanthine dehydrogenase family protein subunit M [Nitrososphaerota archaeon]